MKTEDKYMHVCKLLGEMESGSGQSEFFSELQAVLETADVSLDNLLYERLGVSAEELIKLLAGSIDIAV